MKRLERVEKLEWTMRTPLDRQIETLMQTLLDAGMSEDELRQLINEVKS